MEFLIVGGIAILGYEINKSKYRENKNIDNDYEGEHSMFPFRSSNEIKKNEKKLQKKMNKHFNDENTIGAHNTKLFDGPHNPKPFENMNDHMEIRKEEFINPQPGMKPFFSSEKSQNTNDDFKNRRLSMFTGVENNDEYKHKQEVKQLFSPEETIKWSGNATYYDKQNYKPSNFKRNELPFEQKKVGKGLGVDPTKTVDGGFHSQFRILPNNVNSYKKNTYDGRVIFGKSNIDKIQDVVPFRDFDKSVCQERRPTMPTKAMVNAQSLYSNNSIQKCTDRGNEQSSQHNVYGGPQTYMSANSTRHNDATQLAREGNPMREKMGTGGYSTSSYLTHETGRENCGTITNVIDTSQGTYIKNNDKAKTTLRSTISPSSYVGQISNNQEQYGIDKNISNYNVKETKNTHPTNYIGIMSSSLRADLDRNRNIPNSKNELIYKQQLNQNNTIQGVKQVPYHQNLPDQYKVNDNKENLSTSYTPGKSRINILQDPNKANGMTLYKNDHNDNIVPNITGIRSVNNFTNSSNMGFVQVDQKDYKNDRLKDFKILEKQLKNNPYNHNILTKS
jgi:hypothetical protein